MEKIALILIYNVFVTKKIFFRNGHQKIFFDPHASCRLGRVTDQGGMISVSSESSKIHLLIKVLYIYLI